MNARLTIEIVHRRKSFCQWFWFGVAFGFIALIVVFI